MRKSMFFYDVHNSWHSDSKFTIPFLFLCTKLYTFWMIMWRTGRILTCKSMWYSWYMHPSKFATEFEINIAQLNSLRTSKLTVVHYTYIYKCVLMSTPIFLLGNTILCLINALAMIGYHPYPCDFMDLVMNSLI